MEKISIAFFYPSRITGGAELLFTRLADHLSELGHKTAVIDYEDGFMALNKKHPGVELISYSHIRTTIAGYDYIVAPPSSIHIVKQSLHSSENTKLLFWFLQPYNLLHLFPFSSFLSALPLFVSRFLVKTVFFSQYQSYKEILGLLHRKNGIVFMDSETTKVNEYLFQLSFSQPFLLPIPVPKPIRSLRSPSVTFIPGNGGIRVGWLGRLADFKIHGLNYLIQQLENYSLERKIPVKLYIIGDGDRKSQILLSNEIDIILCGTVRPEELEEFLAANIDILFAMGTSLLEGAKLSIPSVLIDASYRPFPKGYKFKWLYESDGFVLAKMLSGSPDSLNTNAHSLSELLEEIKQESVGERCFQYYQMYHTIESVAQHLTDYLRKASFSYGDLQVHLCPTWSHSIWQYLRGLTKRGQT